MMHIKSGRNHAQPCAMMWLFCWLQLAAKCCQLFAHTLLVLSLRFAHHKASYNKYNIKWMAAIYPIVIECSKQHGWLERHCELKKRKWGFSLLLKISNFFKSSEIAIRHYTKYNSKFSGISKWSLHGWMQKRRRNFSVKIEGYYICVFLSK